MINCLVIVILLKNINVEMGFCGFLLFGLVDYCEFFFYFVFMSLEWFCV